MSEATTLIDIKGEAPNDSRFSVAFNARGLTYILQGLLADQPTDLELVACLPADVWANLKPRIEAEEKTNSWFAARYHELQSGLRLGDGRVGSVWTSPQPTPDGAPAIHVDRIQTQLSYLPEDSRYHDAKGVGSAILDNLCAYADARGWRIQLYPLERDGRLMGSDLIDWYARRGFRFRYELARDDPAREFYPREEMVRLPGTPDQEQPILEALQTEAA